MTMTALAVVPDPPDAKQLASEAATIVAHATEITIVDVASFTAAVEFGKGIKVLQKRIVEFFAPHKANAYKAWKSLCDDERSQLSPAEQAEKIVKEKLLTYQREQREREAAAQREREKIQEKLDEERRLQEAIDLEEQGDVAAADAVLSESITPAAPFIPVSQPTTPKVSGAANTKRWTFDEARVDLSAVLRHIVGVPPDQKLAHPELLNLVALNTKTARQLVTAMRENFNVPGIDAHEADGISLSAKS